jgi:hypothetical protein
MLEERADRAARAPADRGAKGERKEKGESESPAATTGRVVRTKRR